MRNVAGLRRELFEVTLSTEASGCTNVVFSSPFIYCNARFFGDPEAVFTNSVPARRRADGNYELTMAGEFANDTDQLPFYIVSESAYHEAHGLHAELIIARQALREAEESFSENIASCFTGVTF